MTEWLIEHGIGETRAVRVEQSHIIEALIDRDDGRLRAGTVAMARLTTIMPHKRRGVVTLESGGEAIIEPLPPGITEGARLAVEVLREALPERGRPKLPKVVASKAAPAPAPGLEARLRSAGCNPRAVPVTGPDLLEDAGWSELLDEAMRGEIAFAGGGLRISLTPAMTLIDVDGDFAPAELARAGAAAAGAAILRLDITGSIGIDLPTLSSKADRQAAAEALDAALPQPFERTAVNGFGFMQVVRRRTRPSLPELLQADPVAAAALALLRRAERTPGAGALTLTAHPDVIGRIRAHDGWVNALERRSGANIRLAEDPRRPISAGDVSREHP